MERTIVALFDDSDAAQQAVQDLLQSGFVRDHISVMRAADGTDASGGAAPEPAMTHTDGTAKGAGIGAVLGGLAGLVIGLSGFALPGVGAVLVAGPVAVALAGAGVGAATGSVIGALTDIGIPEQEADVFAEGVRRGGTLVAVRADEGEINEAVQVLNRHSPVNVDQRSSAWKAGGWAGFGAQRAGERTEADADRAEQEAALARDTGPAAGRTYASTYDRTTAEMSRTFDMYDPDFRNDWEQTYRASGYGYQRYRPAYQYGYRLATENRYRGQSWKDVEAKARQEWETQHPNDAWEDFKDAIRQAWQTVRDDARGSGS
jgi:hypothetical protein